MRAKYNDKHTVFIETDLVSREPFGQFKEWFDVACKTPGIIEPNAMCLTTASKNAIPSARFVLCKGFGKDGFKFFTNYQSRKAAELSENPNVALVFYWEPLKRQVRIEGTAEKLSATESDEYFHSRYRNSQIGACASRQSSPIAGREVLIKAEEELKEKYAREDIPIPRPDWGGYVVLPHTVEFWQGQTDRLHDRIRYRRLRENETTDNILLHEGEEGWVIERLAP